MGARRASLLIVFLLFPGQAWAHRHKKELVLGVSAVKGSTLAGLDLSVVRAFPTHDDSRNGYLALFVDVGANWGQHDGVYRTQTAGIAGVRYVWPIRSFKPLQPFFHVTAGTVRTSDSGPNGTDTASGPGVGGGLDYSFSREAKYRKVWGRLQYDYVRLTWSEGFARSYNRYSGVVVIRFGEE